MTTVRYATVADALDLAKINTASFEPKPFWRSAFPNIDASQIIPLKYARSLDKLSNPSVHLLVGVDPATQQIRGQARWVIPGQENSNRAVLSEEEAATAASTAQLKPEGMNEVLYQAFLKMLEEKRKVYTKEDDIVLELLATLPEYQGNGVATTLLKWGMQKADELGARIYLEATPEGYPLYRKYGWKDLDEVVMDYSLYGGEGTQKYVFMARDPVRS